MTPEEMKEKATQKELERFRRADVSEVTKERTDFTLAYMEQENLESMETQANQMHRLGMSQLGEMPLSTMEEQKIPKLRENIERKESAKKKEKDQEVDAQKRAEKKGLTVPQERTTTLQQNCTAFTLAQKNAPPPGDYLGIRFADKLNTLFTPDPSTGALDGAAMLDVLHKMNTQIEGYNRAKKAKQPIPPAVAITMEINTNLRNLLQDAVKTYFAAGGVNASNGKTVFSTTAKKAKQHLALSIDRFQHAVAEAKMDCGQKYLDYVSEEKNLAGRLKGQYDDERAAAQDELGVPIIIGSRNREDILEVRSWITNDPEAYENHPQKKVIDKIYGEFLQLHSTLHQEVTKIAQQTKLLTVNHVIPRGMPSMAFEVLKKRKDDLTALELLGSYQQAALKFLLRGRQPEDAATDRYLARTWGLVTQGKESQGLAQAEETLRQMEHANAAFEEEAAATKVRYEAKMRREFQNDFDQGIAQELAFFQQVKERISTAADADPAHQRLQGLKDKVLLKETQGMGSKIEMALKYTPAYERKYSITDKCLKKNRAPEGAKPQTCSNSPLYRDGAQIISPIEGGEALQEAELETYFNHVNVVAHDQYLNGSPVNPETKEEEVKQSYQVLYELFMQNQAEVTEYMDKHHDAFYGVNKTPRQVLDAMIPSVHVHTKVQSLLTGSGLLRKHALFNHLPEEQKKEIEAMRVFFGDVMNYCRATLSTVNEMEREGATPETVNSSALDAPVTGFTKRQGLNNRI